MSNGVCYLAIAFILCILIRISYKRKVSLKLNIQKLRSWHFIPSLHGKQMGEKVEAGTDFIFLGSKVTVDSDCGHEIRRCLLLGSKEAMTNLDTVLKRRTSLCQKRSVQSELWLFHQPCMDVRVEPQRRQSTEELRLLNCGAGEDSRVPWTARGSNQ